MTEQHYVALDAGQSGTRVRIVGPWGLREATLPGVLTDLPLAPQWAAILGDALAELGVTCPPVVLVGSSGVVTPDAAGFLPHVERLGAKRVVVAHDSVTSYLGALGHQCGAVIAAGTGTICLAVGEREAARVDGWGHLIGDAGSAFWIGRTALEAAMRGYDGRRQMTALTEAMREEFPNLESAYVELQSDPNRVARIAAFAGRVDALAATDRVAGNILDKAAAHLSEAVQASLRRVGLMGPAVPHVCAVGGVFASDRVLRRFTDYLTLQWPTFALTVPSGTTLDGSAALLDLPQTHPLAGETSVAQVKAAK